MQGNTLYENEKIKLLGLLIKRIKNLESSVSEQVNTAITNLINGAPEELDTLKELADAIVEFAYKIPKVTSIPQDGFSPNVFYSIGEISQDTTFVLATPEDNTVLNEYLIQFSIGNTVPIITFPNGSSWLNGETPTLNANKSYQLSIIDNLAILAEF